MEQPANPNLTWADMRSFLMEHGHDEMVEQLDAWQKEGDWEERTDPKTGRRIRGAWEQTLPDDAAMVAQAYKALQQLSLFQVDVLLALATFEHDHGIGLKFDPPA